MLTTRQIHKDTTGPESLSYLEVAKGVQLEPNLREGSHEGHKGLEGEAPGALGSQSRDSKTVCVDAVGTWARCTAVDDGELFGLCPEKLFDEGLVLPPPGTTGRQQGEE